MPPSSEVDLMILPSNNEIKSTTVQQIVSNNNDNDNKNISSTPR